MWTLTGTAPDAATGGKWKYFRLDGNNNGFYSNAALKCTLAYNKTMLVDVDDHEVPAETHVTAHGILDDKINHTTAELAVRYYYAEPNNIRFINLNSIQDAGLRDYIRSQLEAISGF